MQVALDRNGVLTLESLRLDRAIDAIRDEGLEHQHLAYFALDSHNIYLKPDDSELPIAHPRIRISHLIQRLYQRRSDSKRLGAVRPLPCGRVPGFPMRPTRYRRCL